MILRSATPPSVSNSYFNASRIGVLYIPADYIDTYKAHDVWGKLSSKMQPVEGSKYEVFNEWEYD